MPFWKTQVAFHNNTDLPLLFTCCQYYAMFFKYVMIEKLVHLVIETNYLWIEFSEESHSDCYYYEAICT